MPKYKPMLIRFDDEGYNLAIKQAKDKIHIYQQAVGFMEKHNLKIKDTTKFERSFTEYFKEQFYEFNREKILIDISVDKLMYLMEVDITRLKALENNYRNHQSLLTFDTEDGQPLPKLERRDFESYTTSSEQNEMLRDARLLVEAIQKVGRHTKVYPFNIGQATSNLIQYDLRKNKYVINITGRSVT